MFEQDWKQKKTNCLQSQMKEAHMKSPSQRDGETLQRWMTLCGKHFQFLCKLKLILGGWRGCSAVKSTDCSSRGHEFKSQQPHGGSQPSVMGSGALFWCVSREQ